MAIPISTAGGLSNIRNNLSGEYYLTNDIDLSSYSNWTAIGDWDEPFSGKLDGKGFTIKNLTCSATEFASLFGYCENAEFNNIKLDNVNIKGDNYVATLVGYGEYCTFDNCKVIASTIKHLNAFDYAIGGLVGSVYGETTRFENCEVECEIIGTTTSGAYAIGGFMGDVYNFESIKCSHKGKIDLSGNAWGIGGFVGVAYGEKSVIRECCHEGDIKVSAGIEGFGSFAGYAWDTEIKDCYSIANVEHGINTQVEDISGFVGELDRSSMENCYYAGTFTPILENYNAFTTDYLTVGMSTIADCYYDNDLCTLSNKFSEVTGKTTTEMYQKSTFENWDFKNTWVILNGHDYPRLRAFPDCKVFSLQALLSSAYLSK